MSFFIIITICLLATFKVTIQSFFGKNNVKTTPDAILFNGLIFVFSVAFFLPYITKQTIPSVILGALFGLFTAIYQITYIKALSIGPVSITVMLANLSTLVPVSVSIFLYNESVSPLRCIGIVLTILAFIICTDFKSGNVKNLKWFVLSLSACLSSGLAQACQKILACEYTIVSVQAFVATSYLFAAIFSAIFYIMFKAKGEKRTMTLNRSVIFGSLLIGITLGIFQAVYTYGASVIHGTILYPSFSGGSMVCAALVGHLIFKDRLSPKQKLSALLCTTAIILINL